MDIRKYLVATEKKYATGTSDVQMANIEPCGKDLLHFDDSCWIQKGRLPRGLAVDFERAWEQKPVDRGTLQMHGNTVTIPRWNQSYIRPYYFSGKLHPAAPMPDAFLPLYEWTRECFSSEKFNQMLVNWYQDGNDYIGAHADAERDLVPHSPILSVSLGQERCFRVRSASDKAIVADVSMPDRSYIMMGGEMQSRYTHEVPKVSGHKGKRMERRINVTFRSFKE